MKKLLTLTCVLALTAMIALTGCAAKPADGEEQASADTNKIYNDGIYEAKSDLDPRGSFGLVKIEIKGDKIIKVDYHEVLANGKAKDEDYGKIIDEKTGEIDQVSYAKAQKARAGQGQYGGKLVEAQDINKVDVISGASGSHKTFINAVNKALEQAKK